MELVIGVYLPFGGEFVELPVRREDENPDLSIAEDRKLLGLLQ